MFALKSLLVPESLKEKLRKPFGKTFSSADRIKIPKDSKLITVGDMVSYNSLKLNPDIIVFDLKMMRKNINKEMKDAVSGFRGKKLVARNPRSHITDELWYAVKEAVKSKSKVKILVKGEEDLAVLPFILESPNSTIILYGLKDRVVLVKVSERLKKKCRELLRYMKGS